MIQVFQGELGKLHFTVLGNDGEERRTKNNEDRADEKKIWGCCSKKAESCFEEVLKIHVV